MIVPLSVLEFRDRAAAYFAGRVGVIDGERRFTYREYAERTHRLASALRGLGLRPGDRVSFISYNTHQLLEAYYGVHRGRWRAQPDQPQTHAGRHRVHP